MMNINTSPRRQITVTRKSLLRSLALIFSVAYGAFIVYSLQLQFSVGSGDIASYIYYFEVAGNTSESVVISADYVFRIAIFAINDYFNIPVLEILSYFAFICSSIVIYIFLINIRSEKYLIYLFPLLLMIFSLKCSNSIFIRYQIWDRIYFTYAGICNVQRLFEVFVIFRRFNNTFINAADAGTLLFIIF